MAINDNSVKWKVIKLTNLQVGSDGYWQPNEEVKVGTVRFPQGSDNVGYILECIEAGTTGEEQPILIGEELANYAEVGRVGQVRVIFNLAEKDVDEVMAMGITYSRLTYPELWEWAGKRAGLIISEEEWQAKFAETNGKFVPYYSSGDGSSTFRTPLLGAYLKGAESGADVGKWLDAGLPNASGRVGFYYGIDDGNATVLGTMIGDGAFREMTERPWGRLWKPSYLGSNNGLTPETQDHAEMFMDLSKSNSIYGNSDTVTPETMTGIWVIKAVGVVVDSGETDIAQFLIAAEEVQERVSAVEDVTVSMTDYIVENYQYGSEWYEVYKSGKVRQGGLCMTDANGYKDVTFLKPMADNAYTVSLCPYQADGSYTNWYAGTSYETTTSMRIAGQASGYTYYAGWVIEGIGA